MRVRLLGGLEVEGIATRDLGSRKGRTLLKLLALARGAPVSGDRIADVLWGDEPPARPLEQIGVLVSRLRPVVGADRITRTDAGWALAVDFLDVAELESRVDEAGKAATPAAALAASRAALALVRGELLADEPDASWADLDRTAVERTVARARLLAAEAALASGAPTDAAADAEAALDHDPYDEAALRTLMRAHVAAGRPASALAAYARARERLAEDLGVDPMTETEELHTSILLAPAPAPDRPPITVVGRARELAALDAVLTDGAVVVEGEAGIGKTALVRAWASTTTAPVLIGRCDELGRDLPLQPVLDALAPHLDDTDLDAVAAADTAAARAMLFGNLVDVVRRAQAVVVIEDIHLAGPSTLEWLAFAVRRGTPVVATTRSTGISGARTVHLGPLDLDDARALVGDARAADLHARSGGNPLFLVELANAGEGDLPHSVVDAVTARVEALGEAATTLRTAAVLGSFDVDLLAGVLDLPVATLLAHLDAGIEARLIDPSLAFRHDLVREALVGETNVARRAFVHHEAARLLAGRSHHDPMAVAFHAEHGGDVEVAAAALLEAARVATARFDNAEAERLLDRAIAIADGPHLRAERARLRIARWDIAGARADARAGGTAALDVAAWAEYYGRDYDLALRYGEEAIARAGDDASRAASLALTGRILHARGDLSGADDRLARAVDAAPPDVRGFARTWLASLRNHQGDATDAAELVERALVDGRWLGHPFALHHGHFARVLSLGQQGRIADAMKAVDVALDVAREAGSASGSRFLAANGNARSWILRSIGRLGEADDINERVFESTDEPGGMEMHCAAVLDLLEGRLLAGDVDGATKAVERARVVESFDGTMAWHHRQRLLTQRARLAVLQGEPFDELASTAIDDAVARGSLRYELLARAVRGETDVLPRLERVAGMEAWWMTAELAARGGDDGLWRDAERRAATLMRLAGPYADELRTWVATRLTALGRP